MKRQIDLNWKREKIAQFNQSKVEESTNYEKQRIKAKLSRMK